MTEFSPREIVSELDRYIVGQHMAKRAVAIALRNRWRRLKLVSLHQEDEGGESRDWDLPSADRGASRGADAVAIFRRRTPKR